MGGLVAGWHIKGSKWSILWDTSTIIGISMMILQVGAFGRVKYFPRPSILLLNLDTRTNFPKCLSNSFE